MTVLPVMPTVYFGRRPEQRRVACGSPGHRITWTTVPQHPFGVPPVPRVSHFEIHADDPERAIKFYSDLFGWQFKKRDGPMPYWLVTTGPDSEPGINGGLMKRMGPGPADMQLVNAYVCTT